jgi:hypothetical protein
LEVFLEQTSPLLIQRDSGELFKCKHINALQTVVFTLVGPEVEFLLVAEGNDASSSAKRREDTATLLGFREN